MNKRILGIDTGTNSLGWAVVDRAEDGTYSLIEKGSFIFTEGVKIEKGNETSKAAERTKYRAVRKHYFRRRLRKIEALKVLVKYKWCPFISDEALHEWHVKKTYPMEEEFLAWQRTDDGQDKNPYNCRHICLHEKLDLNKEADRFTLGRALYHLAQRRGFKSNRLDQSGDSKENGKVKEGISELSQEMKEAGFEYLGDYFYHLYKNLGNTVRIRHRYTDRDEHYKKEFYAICEMQMLSKEQIAELEKALYFQRPLKSQRKGVGKCTFEPHKSRCADSHPDYERFRMLQFINNIKVKGPYDTELRPLNTTEREKATSCFFRKSVSQFDFEDIAKAIAGKNKYQYIKEVGDKPYKFNFRMSQSATGCTTTACLKSIFGEDYANGIAEVYTLAGNKTVEQMVNDVWNVLYSFSDKENLKQWATDKLQLDEKKAEQFSKIRLSHGFASLSRSAICRILPWMEKGMIYPHAVLMAKVPDIVGLYIWEKHSSEITSDLMELFTNFRPEDRSLQGTLDFCIKDYLLNKFDLPAGAADKLYHPSMMETYLDAKTNADGIFQLDSPKTNAIRNPMAMRSLYQLRKVVNALLRKKVIDTNTEVHIEYARELNDANKRKAIATWNKQRENKRKKYKEEIIRLYHEKTGQDIVPTEDDIDRYELWTEQSHICLYTGKEIDITEIIGSNPVYDFEHTIPQSVGGDSTMENLTLCSCRFNREVKKTKIPTQLANHDEIMVRLEKWREDIEELRKKLDKVHTHSSMAKDIKDKQIQKRHLLRMELDYWQGKYKRFTMEEVPEGFSRKQGAGIGLVGKYAGLYLKSLFHKKEDRTRSNVRVVKGAITAEFRKAWGIQDEFEKKSRDNHVHHCIDAIVIACIGTGEYNAIARYYQQKEAYERSEAASPTFPKPWPTFTEDIKALAAEVLVVHDTPNNLPKYGSRLVQTPNGKHRTHGDIARGSLHMDTYYGAIERDGEIRYVVRRELSSFEKMSDLDNIVDEAVREKVKAVVAEKGFKEALQGCIYMNEEKGITIKKVRCYANDIKKTPIKIREKKIRDLSQKEYKRSFYVKNEENYLLAIYEGCVKGKPKRDYELVKNIEAAAFFKQSTDKQDFPTIVPEKSEKGFPLKYILRTGMHVILYENTAQEIDFNDTQDIGRRLYIITGLNFNPTGPGYGRVVMRHHQEARMAKEIKEEKGAYKIGEVLRASIGMSYLQFNALVEGRDFRITPLGEIILRHSL